MYEMIGVNGTLSISADGEVSITKMGQRMEVDCEYKTLLYMLKNIVCDKKILLESVSLFTKEEISELERKLDELKKMNYVSSEYDFSATRCFERYMDKCAINTCGLSYSLSKKAYVIKNSLIKGCFRQMFFYAFPSLLYGEKRKVYRFICKNKQCSVEDIKNSNIIPSDKVYKTLFDLQSLSLINQEKVD